MNKTLLIALILIAGELSAQPVLRRRIAPAAGGGGGDVTFVAEIDTSILDASTTDTLKIAHTVGSGSNRGMTVSFASRDLDIKSGMKVEWKGTGAAEVFDSLFMISGTGDRTVATFGLKNPTSGAGEIRILNTGGNFFDCSAVMYEFYNVNQTTPFTAVLAEADPADWSHTKTTASGDYVVGVASVSDVGANQFTAGTGVLGFYFYAETANNFETAFGRKPAIGASTDFAFNGSVEAGSMGTVVVQKAP